MSTTPALGAEAFRTLSDELSLARVHEIQTELEIRFKQDAPELFRVLIHPEPSTDNRR